MRQKSSCVEASTHRTPEDIVSNFQQKLAKREYLKEQIETLSQQNDEYSPQEIADFAESIRGKWFEHDGDSYLIYTAYFSEQQTMYLKYIRIYEDEDLRYFGDNDGVCVIQFKEEWCDIPDFLEDYHPIENYQSELLDKTLELLKKFGSLKNE